MPFVSSQYFIDGVVAGSGVVADDPVVDGASVADGAPVVDGAMAVVGAGVSGSCEKRTVGGAPGVEVVIVVVVISTHATVPIVTYEKDINAKTFVNDKLKQKLKSQLSAA